MQKNITWIIVTLSAGLILAATTWNFAATANAPTKYADKEINRLEHLEINKHIDNNQKELLDKLDAIKTLIIELHNTE